MGLGIGLRQGLGRHVKLPLLVAVLLVGSFGFVPAEGPSTAVAGASENMRHVANIPYAGGTDMEFTTIDVTGLPEADAAGLSGEREFALAGAYEQGLNIVDITDPEAPVNHRYDCAMAQADTQVFTRDDLGPDPRTGRTLRTFVTFTADDPYGGETKVTSECYQQLGGMAVQIRNGTKFGTVIIEITNPFDPIARGFAPVARGSHNMTVHPSGKFLYNSNSDIDAPGEVKVFDITDVTNPVLATTLALQTGAHSHDITFNEDGTRAYSAAVTHSLVINTEDPANPQIIGRVVDPGINIHHQSDPVTLTDATTGMEHTFLVVTDELAGAAGNGFCPGGGLHIYDITGDLERAPVKVGFWNIPEVNVMEGPGNGTGGLVRCTSHVLRLHGDEGLMTIAWYSQGVRVVDISGLVGVAVGVDEANTGNVGPGMKEVGFMKFDDSDTWSVKTNKFERDAEGNVTGFYMFGNDQTRGFDVYHIDLTAAPAANAGQWLTPQQALARAQARPQIDLNQVTLSCFLGSTSS